MSDYDFSALPDPQIDAQFYAGVPFKRLLAWFIDLCAIFLFLVAISILTLGIGLYLFPITLFSINLGYRIYCLNRFSATLGMIITGVELRNHLGEKLSIKDSINHTLAHSVMIIFGAFIVISSIMMLINKRGHGLHDFFLGITAINRPVDH